MAEKREFHARSERIESLVRQLEGASDPELHAVALELVQCVMDLHGAALERILHILNETGVFEHVTEKLLDDDLVASLLLLHSLHPHDLEARIHRALQQVHPTLELHGCEAELLGIDAGVVRLRLKRHGGGCGSTATTMQTTLEDAITEAAPDAAQVQIEIVQHTPASQLVSITQPSLNAQEETW